MVKGRGKGTCRGRGRGRTTPARGEAREAAELKLATYPPPHGPVEKEVEMEIEEDVKPKVEAQVRGAAYEAKFHVLSHYATQLVAQEKVRSIKPKLLVAQSRQKKYADHKVRDMTFQVAEQLLLKVSHMKGMVRFGKKDKDLEYEEDLVTILDRDVWKLRTNEIKSVKVQCKHLPIEEATWETEWDM
ncbi:hypothetical protein MTR67_048760 [Solanum verrucosum]|uniref:Uncharacterized protein n=1 Tax=Solanum verrucosum TaxID=315347 RepID=A0AAF0UZ18_SOLVR|nr:hypothetical protein MTR67_048760 [Solanum verrucosum]